MPMMYSSTLLLNIRQKGGDTDCFLPWLLEKNTVYRDSGVLFAGCNEPRAQEMVTCGDRCHASLLYFPLPDSIACLHFFPATSLGFFLFFQHQFGNGLDIIPFISLSILVPLLLPPSTSHSKTQLSSQIGE